MTPPNDTTLSLIQFLSKAKTGALPTVPPAPIVDWAFLEAATGGAEWGHLERDLNLVTEYLIEQPFSFKDYAPGTEEQLQRLRRRANRLTASIQAKQTRCLKNLAFHAFPGTHTAHAIGGVQDWHFKSPSKESLADMQGTLPHLIERSEGPLLKGQALTRTVALTTEKERRLRALFTTWLQARYGVSPAACAHDLLGLDG